MSVAKCGLNAILYFSKRWSDSPYLKWLSCAELGTAQPQLLQNIHCVQYADQDMTYVPTICTNVLNVLSVLEIKIKYDLNYEMQKKK